jgi:hypothetical protein
LCDLYAVHVGEKPRLVAVLSGDDEKDWTNELGHLVARVSGDGSRLAFMSDRSLTGYDTQDANSGKPDEEVYLYDANAGGGAGRVVCVSCDPTGARPVGVEYVTLSPLGVISGGDRVWEGHQWIGASIPGWTSYVIGDALYQSRSLSDSGRVFFETPDALVPQDINGNEDVYEYEPVGVGDCSTGSVTFSGASDGCVGLISSGTAIGETAFLDASENGNDVFFLTGEKLVSEDVDTALDVYDAHQCTSESPCVSVPVGSPECTTADACRASPSLQPSVFGAPASATFSGAGNITQPGPGTGVKARSLTRAQQLAQALRACRKKKEKARRRVCEAQARGRYAAKRARRASRSRVTGSGAMKRGRG